MALPDLNSYQPSRYLRMVPPARILLWFHHPPGAQKPQTVYVAGQCASAGCYRDLERGLIVRLKAEGLLPDLQTGQPSRYIKVRGGNVCYRKQP